MQSEGHLLLKYLQAAQRPEIIARISRGGSRKISRTQRRFPQSQSFEEKS